MPNPHMAIALLEMPYGRIGSAGGDATVAPMLQTLASLQGVPLYGSQFHDRQGFGPALAHIVTAASAPGVDSLVLYVASHGNGSRIGNEYNPAMNLATAFNLIHLHARGRVNGLVLDICEVGGQTALIEACMRKSGLDWVVGYGAAIEWLTATTIGLHVVAKMACLKRRYRRDPEGLLVAVQEAMRLFDPNLLLDRDAEDPMRLQDVLTIALRPRRQRPRTLIPQEIWPALTVA